MSIVFLVTSVVYKNDLLSTNVVASPLVFKYHSFAALALKDSNQVGIKKSRLA